MSLFGFYRKLFGYKSPDPADVEASGEAGAQHAAYHRRVFLAGCVFGVVGAALALVLVLAAFAEREPATGREINALWLFPLFGGACGFLFGMAVLCLFAPKEFLSGPVGRKWMKLIGTRNVPVARAVCLVCALVVPAAAAAILILLSLTK